MTPNPTSLHEVNLNINMLLTALESQHIKIGQLENFYDETLQGMSEEIKLLEDRIEELEETLEGVEFETVDDDTEEEKEGFIIP